MLSHGSSSFLSEDRSIKAEFNGREWKFSVWRVADHHEKGEYIASLCPKPVHQLANIPADCPPEVRTEAVRYAVELSSSIQVLTPSDEQAFDNSHAGMGYRVWRALRDSHPEFGYSEVPSEWVHKVGPDRGYTMGPKEGIEIGLKWYESSIKDSTDMARIQAILLGVTDVDIVKNLGGLSQKEASLVEAVNESISQSQDDQDSPGNSSTEK